jgi:hypothetical protein
VTKVIDIAIWTSFYMTATGIQLSLDYSRRDDHAHLMRYLHSNLTSLDHPVKIGTGHMVYMTNDQHLLISPLALAKIVNNSLQRFIYIHRGVGSSPATYIQVQQTQLKHVATYRLL